MHPHSDRLRQHYFGFGLSAGLDGDPFAVVSYIEWDPIFYGVPTEGLVDAETIRQAVSGPSIGDARGRWGVGTSHHLALHVRTRNALLRWKRRLTDIGVDVTGPYDRNYFHSIYFRGPDGELLEIATTEPGFAHDEEVLGESHRSAPTHTMVGARTEDAVAEETWPRPVAGLDSDLELAGIHHVTAVASDNDRTADFFVDAVGLRLIKKTDYMDAEGATHYYFSAGAEAAPGSILTFFGFPTHEPGRLGVGMTHHYAFTATDDTLDSWRSDILQAGIEVGPVQDHVYFRSFYFRDPDGHICAVATPPRFTVDEEEGALGTNLCLPPRGSRNGEPKSSERSRSSPPRWLPEDPWAKSMSPRSSRSRPTPARPSLRPRRFPRSRPRSRTGARPCPRRTDHAGRAPGRRPAGAGRTHRSRPAADRGSRAPSSRSTGA